MTQPGRVDDASLLVIEPNGRLFVQRQFVSSNLKRAGIKEVPGHGRRHSWAVGAPRNGHIDGRGDLIRQPVPGQRAGQTQRGQGRPSGDAQQVNIGKVVQVCTTEQATADGLDGTLVPKWASKSRLGRYALV